MCLVLWIFFMVSIGLMWFMPGKRLFKYLAFGKFQARGSSRGEEVYEEARAVSP